MGKKRVVTKAGTKRAGNTKISKTAKKKGISPPKLVAKLTDAERDLLWHMDHGYELETDSLGGNLVLRLKDGTLVRPLSANRNTVKALQERGLISPGKSKDPLTMVWRLTKK